MLQLVAQDAMNDPVKHSAATLALVLSSSADEFGIAGPMASHLPPAAELETAAPVMSRLAGFLLIFCFCGPLISF